VPAIARLAALLSNVTSKGLLNRAHAYKASVAANVEAGRDPDHGLPARRPGARRRAMTAMGLDLAW
jgi:tryptophanyl-tRNA synthetase